MAQVAATGPEADPWLYELAPSHQMPIVNVKVSVAARLLSDRALGRFKRLVVYQRQISLGMAVAIIAYPLVMVIDAKIGRIIAFPLSVMGLPAVALNIGFLCYDVIPLLFRSFDSWFLSLINFSSLAVLAGLYRDFRAAGVVVACFVTSPSLFVDANIVRVRRLAILSIVAALSTVFCIVVVMLDIIDETHNFVLLWYKTHQLPARAYLINGLTTMALLMIRNVYRKRQTLLSDQATYTVIECASYRCRLQFAPPNKSRTATTRSKRPDWMKRMRYIPICKGMIDARQTLLLTLSTTQIFRHPYTRAMTAMFGTCSVMCSVVANPIDRYYRQNYYPHAVPVIQLLALAMTVIYCGLSMAFYQRQMLMLVYTSFNFAFPLGHTLIVSVLLCDFHHWHMDCLLLVTIVNLWIHWAMCSDALTPYVKQLLGFRLRFVAFVYGVAIIGSIVTIGYVMVFAESSTSIHDRILWQGTVLNNQVIIRELPLFYNSFGIALCLSLRLLVRLCTYSNADLVLIDGAVVYGTCLKSNNKVVQCKPEAPPHSLVQASSEYSRAVG